MVPKVEEDKAQNTQTLRHSELLHFESKRIPQLRAYQENLTTQRIGRP